MPLVSFLCDSGLGLFLHRFLISVPYFSTQITLISFDTHLLNVHKYFIINIYGEREIDTETGQILYQREGEEGGKVSRVQNSQKG